jgi:hypothetical protein
MNKLERKNKRFEKILFLVSLYKDLNDSSLRRRVARRVRDLLWKNIYE